MIYIYYLPKEFTKDIELPCHRDNNNFEDQMLEHPKTKRYSLYSFEKLFNKDKVNDGWLVFKDVPAEELANELVERYKINKRPDPQYTFYEKPKDE